MRGCRICKGKLKREHRCMFCGFQIKRKRDMDKMDLLKEESHEEKLEYLRLTRAKLLKFRMMSTGCETLDKQVIHYYGDWRNEIR